MELVSANRTMMFAGGKGATATEGAMTAEDALDRAGLNFKLELWEAGARKNDKVKATWNAATQRALVRPDTGEIFGFVKGRYEVINNDQLFAFADLIAGETGANYEAAWSLFGGRQVGLTMKFPDGIKVAGEDPIDKYLLIHARHDGSGAVAARITNVRLYCTNMLNVAFRGAQSTVKVRHTRNASQKMAAAREVLEVGSTYQDRFTETMNQMAERELSNDRARELLVSVLVDHGIGKADEKVDAIERLRIESPNLQDSVRNTVYGALQATVEWLDWYRPSERQTVTGRQDDLLVGRPVKIKNDLVDRLTEVLAN